MWDIAAGGVVAAGETYDDAARRELAEELGVTGVPLHYLGEGRYRDDAVALIGRGYTVVCDGPFVFTDGEIAEVRWVDRDDLETMLASERFVPDNLALLLASLLFGLVHVGAGWHWVLLASIAGVGYGMAYRFGGLGAAVATHFGLNLLHFGLFTYPMLAG